MWRALWAWYAPPTPLVRLRLLRLVVGAYALIYLVTRAGHLNAVLRYPASAFHPVGVAQILSQPLSAGWVHATYITPDTEAIAADASEAFVRAVTDFAVKAARLNHTTVSPSERRQLDLLKTSLTMSAPADPGAGSTSVAG